MKKICYLVLAHSDPQHFEKLVNAIDYRANIFVHLDLKSDIRKFEKLSLPTSLYFIPNRVRVSWGGISMVDATLNLIEVAVSTGEDFSHLVLISGADYPIRNVSLLYQKLVSQPQRQFIKYIDMRESDHYLKQVTQKWFKEPLFYTPNKALMLFDKTLRSLLTKFKFRNNWDQSIIPYFGSQWWALTPDCARYVLQFVKANPSYYAQNKNTFSPDEHFFHTIIGNSSFRDSTDATYKFTKRGTWKMSNLHIIHHSLHKWYTMDDWEDIIASDKFFVRKLKSSVSGSLVDKLNVERIAVLQ